MSEEKLIANLVHRLVGHLNEILARVPKDCLEAPQDTLLQTLEAGLIPLCIQSVDFCLKYVVAAIDRLTKIQTPTEDMVARTNLALVYLLNVFSKCAQYKWDHIKQQFKNVQGVSTQGKIRLQEKIEQILPPPLDERLARECYSKITPMVNKSQAPKVQQAAARAFFLLSVYNFDTVIANATQHMLPHGNPSEEDILANLTLLQHTNFNSTHLSELLTKVEGATQIYKKDKIRVVLSKVLRKAIWNWIDNYQIEFVSLCQGAKIIQGNPENLFDIFLGWSGNSKKDRIFWPVQTMLLILCPDIMLKVAKGETGDTREQFLDNLKRSLKGGGRMADVAAICCADICKASTFVSKTDTSALQIIVPFIENELKERLFNENQKFKDADGNMDESLMADCLVSFFRLGTTQKNATFLPLFNDLFEGNSVNFKRVLVKTLLRIAHEGASLPWNPTLQDIYPTLSGKVRTLFQSFKSSGETFLSSRGATGKKGERQIEKATVELDVLINLIELFNSDPALALYPDPSDPVSPIKDLILGICSCIPFLEIPELHDTAAKTLLTFHKPEIIAKWSPKVQDSFWSISSLVNSSLARILIENNQMQPNDVKKIISILHQILAYRIKFFEAFPDVIPTASSKPLRYESSSRMETAMLIHMCSAEPEIVLLCAECFGLLCAEVNHLQHCINETDTSILANHRAYEQLASAGTITTGRQAQQKALRNMLRHVDHPTNGNYEAWTGIHERWKLYTMAFIRNEEIQAEELRLKEEERDVNKPKKVRKKVVPIGGRNAEEDREAKYASLPKTLLDKKPIEVQNEWNNYLGFLCSLAAVCQGREGLVKTTDKKTRNVLEKKVLIIDDFIGTMMEFLVHEYVPIRASVKVSVGNSLSPAIYSVLFKALQQEISRFFKSSSQVEVNADSILFVDQAISVIKLIIETTEDPNQLGLLSNFEELVMSSVNFVRQLIFGEETFQTRLKLAGLIETMMRKSAHIPFENENSFRMQLLENTMEWTSEFFLKEFASADERIRKLIKDLDLQVMQSACLLLKNFPLQGKDDDAKSEAFSKFFTFFTRFLNRCKNDPSSVHPQLNEATIESISSLVTANMEHGLEYFISMGYHENNETRSSFLTVLSNILKQGGGFDRVEEDDDKYYKLSELIMDPKLETVLTLCDVTPITEAEIIATLLVRVFEANQRTVELIKAAIEKEVRTTEKANTLFRLNSMATKLMAQYCKLIGVNYLRASVGPEIRSLIASTPPMEMDPSKLPQGQDLAVNSANVKKSSEKFLLDIENSVPQCPRPFREICAHLKSVVGAKFPDAEHTAIAGFIFLRFLCPAMIAPDGFQVVNAPVKDKDTRRGLVLITKVIQNLANRQHFVKEPFMDCMNAYIDDNLDTIRKMLDLYAEIPEDAPKAEVSFTDEEKLGDMETLHYHLFLAREKLSKAFTEASASDPQGQSNWFEKLATILTGLGEPPEPSNKKPVVARPLISTGQNTHYDEFMKKMARQETDSVKAQGIYYAQGKTKKGIPVLYYIARNLKPDQDLEKLFFYILKTTQPFLEKSYSLVIDLSHLSPDHFIHPSGAGKMAKILPNQAFDNLDTVYLFHPNLNFKKYIKRIAKFVGRAQKKILVCSFLDQLYEHIKENECGLPEASMNLEMNVQSSFSPVTKIMFNKKSEIELRISKDFLQIVTLKPHSLLNHSALLVEFLHVSTILEVSPGHKENEAILKFGSGGQTNIINLLSKSNASQMIQQISESRERYNLSRPQNALAKKAFQPSDVPGTLLNMALLNLTSANHSLRIAAYNLLTAACHSFSYNLDTNLLAATKIAVGRHCMHFVSRISEELSKRETGLTLEFLLRAIQGIATADKISKVYILQYMKPWLVNLQLYCISATEDRDMIEKRTKTKDLVMQLLKLSTTEAMPVVLSSVWDPISKLNNEVIHLVFDCIVELSTAPGVVLGSKVLSCLEEILISFASSNRSAISGRIINRTISLLMTPLSVTIDRLESHESWLLIELYIRWMMILSYENLICVEQYLPELLHIISLTYGTGDSMIRGSTYALFMNVAHSSFTAGLCHQDKLQTLRSLVNEFQTLSCKVPFGVGASGKNHSPFQTSSTRDSKLERFSIETVTVVTQSLFNVLNCFTDKPTSFGTPYHTRWLSLTSRVAFTPNAALQSRAIITLGILSSAPSFVSSELFGELLHLLKLGLYNSIDKQLDSIVIALVSCLGNMYSYLSPWSKYFKPFFWLAVGLVQVHDPELFVVALPMLETVVRTLNETGHFREDGMADFCLSARKGNLEGLLEKFDTVTGLSFTNNFSFAISSLLLKGLKTPTAKNLTVRTLGTILRLCSEKDPVKTTGYFAALLPIKGIDDAELFALKPFSDPEVIICESSLVTDENIASLLLFFLSTILKTSDFEHEQLVIYKIFLEELRFMPQAFPIVFDQIQGKLSQVLLNSQNEEIIKIVHAINYQVCNSVCGSHSQGKQQLQKLGFSGLADHCQFDVKKKATQVQNVGKILDALLE